MMFFRWVNGLRGQSIFVSKFKMLGTGFTMDVIYGDDYSKRVYGLHSQTNDHEIFGIAIP